MDGVTAALSGNDGGGGEYALVAQGPAIVSGTDEVLSLDEDAALTLNLTLLDASAPEGE